MSSLNTKFWKILTLLIFSIFLTTILANSVNATWWNESFDYRQSINITNPHSVSLSNFPIFINVSKRSGMQSDYDDIRFVNGTCEQGGGAVIYQYELEYSNSNYAAFWVKINTLRAGINNLCMYYGNSGYSSQANRNNVWKSNYGIVYHMDSSGDDSTSNNRDRVSTVGSPTAYNNRLGYGLYFDGNDAWSMANMAYWEQEWTSRGHEAVFQTGASTNTRQTIYAEGGGVNGILMYIYQNRLWARWWSESAPNWGGDAIATPICANKYYHAVMQLEETGNYSLYLNGRKVGSRVSPDHIDAHSGDGGIAYTNTAKDFNDSSQTGVYLNGYLYELRVFNAIESDQWINMSALTTINYTKISAYGAENINPDILSVTVLKPNYASITSVEINDTFELNVTISCNSNVVSCGNITAYPVYNTSLSTFATIPTSYTIPTWTRDNIPQSCIVGIGSSCSLQWEINATENITHFIKYRVNITSNYSYLEPKFSENVTIEIVDGPAVIFNQTSINLPQFTKALGPVSANVSVVSSNGNNTLINVACTSGDCAEITDNWVDGSNLNYTQELNFSFSCNSAIDGTYNAIFSVTSNEDTIPSTIAVTCLVNPIYGPISVNVTNPPTAIITNISHDRLFLYNATINCNETCGNITAYPIIDSKLGSGIDGVLNVSTSNLIINTYTFLNANEILGDNVITVNSTTGFNIGDEILIIQMQNGSGIGNAGSYEFRRITGIYGYNFTLNSNLENTYGSGTFNSTSASATQIVRIPNYINVTINTGSSITSPAWNGFRGGIVSFRALDTVIMNGFVDVSAKGFRGGDCNGCGDSAWGDQGEGYLGMGIGALAANGNGGGGGYGPSGFNGEPGAGGGYGTSGSDGTSSFTSTGGSSIGDANLTTIFFGGGAGGGGDDDNPTIRAEYVDGGGAALIFANTIRDARINANGEDGVGNGGSAGTTGGGAGGAIWVYGYNITISSITAIGGIGFIDSDDNGGNGGVGRIRIDKIESSGATTPAAGLTNTMTRYPLILESPRFISCIPGISGNCILTWNINTTGEVNSIHELFVIIDANYSAIDRNISDISFVKIINLFPKINLLSPLNDYKVIYYGIPFNFSFSITDQDDYNFTCMFYVNNINEENRTPCYNNTINQISLNPGSGTHNWSVTAIDNRGATNYSNTFNFTLIDGKHIEISKEISSSGVSNLYIVNQTLINHLNLTESIHVGNFIHDNLTVGAAIPSFDFFNLTYGIYIGEIYVWNFSVTPQSYNYLSYPITSGVDYELLDLFIVGGID